MKSHFGDNKYLTIALYCVAAVTVSALIVLAVFNLDKLPGLLSTLSKILSPFIYGFIIAYFCNPLLKLFEKHVFRFKGKAARLNRPLAVTLTMIVVLLLITLIILIVIPQLTHSYQDLIENTQNYVSAAQGVADDFVKNFVLFNGQYENLSAFLDANDIATDLKTFISTAASFLTSSADSIVKSIVSIVTGVANILMGFIVSIYLLLTKDRLIAQAKKILAAFLDRRRYLNVVRLGRFTNESIGGFVTGKLLDSFIIGLLSFIIFAIFAIPYAPLIAVIVGITNLIPFFGPIIGAIPSAFIVLIADPGKTITFIILILIIQQFDGNVLGPRILGDSTGLSALSVLVAITVFGGLFGLAGMFLGVPLYAVIREIVVQHLNRRLVHRSMPKSLDFYASDPPPTDSKNETIFIDRSTEVETPHVDYSDEEAEHFETVPDTKRGWSFSGIAAFCGNIAQKTADLYKKARAKISARIHK